MREPNNQKPITEQTSVSIKVLIAIVTATVWLTGNIWTLKWKVEQSIENQKTFVTRQEFRDWSRDLREANGASVSVPIPKSEASIR